MHNFFLSILNHPRYSYGTPVIIAFEGSGNDSLYIPERLTLALKDFVSRAPFHIMRRIRAKDHIDAGVPKNPRATEFMRRMIIALMKHGQLIIPKDVIASGAVQPFKTQTELLRKLHEQFLNYEERDGVLTGKVRGKQDDALIAYATSLLWAQNMCCSREIEDMFFKEQFPNLRASWDCGAASYFVSDKIW